MKLIAGWNEIIQPNSIGWWLNFMAARQQRHSHSWNWILIQLMNGISAWQPANFIFYVCGTGGKMRINHLILWNKIKWIDCCVSHRRVPFVFHWRIIIFINWLNQSIKWKWMDAFIPNKWRYIITVWVILWIWYKDRY